MALRKGKKVTRAELLVVKASVVRGVAKGKFRGFSFSKSEMMMARDELKRRGLKMKPMKSKKSSKFMLGKPSVTVPTPRSL